MKRNVTTLLLTELPSEKHTNYNGSEEKCYLGYGACGHTRFDYLKPFDDDDDDDEGI